MRAFVPAIMVSVACLSLSAQNTGRFFGKVVTKEGKPVPNAVLTMSRVDINWSKDVKADESGSFIQIGLEPKHFQILVKAAGFVDLKFPFKVEMGDGKPQSITMLTKEQAAQEAGASTPTGDKGAQLDIEAASAFNQAVGLFNEQKFQEALPLVEKAHAAMTESLKLTTDEKVKAETQTKLLTVERVLATSLFEAGKADETTRMDRWTKAEPLLTKLAEKNAKDPRFPTYLMEIAKAKGDKAAAQKYQAVVDALVGPRPELAYNEAVNAFNAGNMKAAKENLEKAIQIDPKYAEAYYLLGMTEYGLGSLKATKQAFEKYLELAPTGKHAAEVKQAMKDDPAIAKAK